MVNWLLSEFFLGSAVCDNLHTGLKANAAYDRQDNSITNVFKAPCPKHFLHNQ